VAFFASGWKDRVIWLGQVPVLLGIGGAFYVDFAGFPSGQRVALIVSGFAIAEI